MIALRLKNHQIVNYGKLSEYFDINDVIGNKEVFLSFAKSQLVWEAMDRYHVNMLAAACSGDMAWNRDVQFNPDAYYRNPYQLAIKDYELQDALEEKLKEENCSEGKSSLDEYIYDSVMKAEISDINKENLFVFLTAVYKLARKDVTTDQINISSIVDAWFGKKPENMNENIQIDVLANSVANTEGSEQKEIREITLTPGKGGYRIFKYPKQYLDDGMRIQTVLLHAESSGSRYGVVEIEVFSEGQENHLLERIIIKQGEYIYANITDGKLIKCLETVSANNDCTMEREHLGTDILTVRLDKNVKSYELEDVSSFAVEYRGSGFLAVKNNRLVTTYYSGRHLYTQLEVIEGRKVVEVRIIDGNYLILQDNGKVYSSINEYKQLRNIANLADLETGGDMYGEKQ
jgi:hypothetical protein